LINQPSRYQPPPQLGPIKRLRGLTRANTTESSFRAYKLHDSTQSQLFSIMAPKRNPRDSTPASTATAQSSGTSTPVPAPIKSKQSNNLAPQEIALGVWQHYLETTPQRTKLIDVFMVFLVVVGGLQFVYCLISGNYVCPLRNSMGRQKTDYCASSPSMPFFPGSRPPWANLS
jgi:hypothetical protein